LFSSMSSASVRATPVIAIDLSQLQELQQRVTLEREKIQQVHRQQQQFQARSEPLHGETKISATEKATPMCLEDWLEEVRKNAPDVRHGDWCRFEQPKEKPLYQMWLESLGAQQLTDRDGAETTVSLENTRHFKFEHWRDHILQLSRALKTPLSVFAWSWPSKKDVTLRFARTGVLPRGLLSSSRSMAIFSPHGRPLDWTVCISYEDIGQVSPPSGIAWMDWLRIKDLPLTHCSFEADADNSGHSMVLSHAVKNLSVSVHMRSAHTVLSDACSLGDSARRNDDYRESKYVKCVECLHSKQILDFERLQAASDKPRTAVEMWTRQQHSLARRRERERRAVASTVVEAKGASAGATTRNAGAGMGTNAGGPSQSAPMSMRIDYCIGAELCSSTHAKKFERCSLFHQSLVTRGPDGQTHIRLCATPYFGETFVDVQSATGERNMGSWSDPCGNVCFCS
jgi:hypothetical protein